jgi:zinc protease
VDYVLGAIDETIAKFRAEPPDSKRVADLQRRLRYGFLMGLTTPDSVAARVARFIALSGDLRGLDRLHATYAAITPADVRAAAERYLHPQRRTVGVLRPRP